MARISQAELERLKSEISLERLAEARGVKLERKGADLHGLCPFHVEKTPSLVITPEKNLWKCFGECQEGGDVIAWVQKAEGVSFRHAVEILRGDLPSLAAGSSGPRPVVKKCTVRKLSPLADSSIEDQELLNRVARYYHETLKASPEALGYLQSRGLVNSELVEHFQLGFANRTLGYKLPASNRLEGKEIRGKLKAFGILRKSGHEHLRGSLVVPLFDADGKLVQMYGRKITGNLRSGTPDHLYLPGPQRGVFNLAGILASEEVILCESLFDAMTFWSAGIRNVTTAYGVGGLNQDLWEAFEKAGTKRVLIAFDRDKAGNAGAKKLACQLNERGIAAYRVEFPKGMDVNEFAQKVTPAAKSLSLAIRNAVWMGEGKASARGLPVELEVDAPKQAAKGENSPGAGETKEAPRQAVAPSPEKTLGPPAPAPPLAVDPKPDPERPLSPHRIPPKIPVPTLRQEGLNHWLKLGDRSYRVRELFRNTSPGTLKVNLMVSRESALPAGSGFHLDTLDLCKDRDRCAFAKRAGQELGLETATMMRDIGKLLLVLEEARDQHIQELLTPKKQVVEIPDDERKEAMELLKDPRLLDIILEDFNRCGVVGEEVNKLVGYLGATSRKLRRPLALVVQSVSSGGKSSLMEAVIAFMPPEELIAYSAMTGQSLFYMEDENLSHKILAIAEEEGIQKASYALKLLQSEGKLSIASTSKDPVNGRHKTEKYKVEGPVMIFLTTTAEKVDEELMNRCLVLAVDEGREQTRTIHKLQRKGQSLEGLFLGKERERILRRQRNAQRLIRTLHVVNPYAESLTFTDHQARSRRDHMKYLTLIQTVTLIHQYQRVVKKAGVGDKELEYIEVTREDIAIANRLAHEVLGRSLDELSPQTRHFLRELTKLVDHRMKTGGLEQEEVRFTRREVREWVSLGGTQVWNHLNILVDLEYLLVFTEGRSGQKFYELVYREDQGERSSYLPGLIDLEALGEKTAGKSAPKPDETDPDETTTATVSEEKLHAFTEDAHAFTTVSPRFRPAFTAVSEGIESQETASNKGLETSSKEEVSAFSKTARYRSSQSQGPAVVVVPVNGDRDPSSNAA